MKMSTKHIQIFKEQAQTRQEYYQSHHHNVEKGRFSDFNKAHYFWKKDRDTSLLVEIALEKRNETDDSDRHHHQDETFVFI